MATAAATAIQTGLSEQHQQLGKELDEDILQIRAQIRELTEKKRLLSSTLLQSSKHQQGQRSPNKANKDLEATNPLLAESQLHAQTNAHRIALGVTSFPFSDPHPDTLEKRLLGIRFDICGLKGRYDQPYYVICAREEDSPEELRVHRHTIPAFIPLRDYEEQYLPLSAEPQGSSLSKQDLHTFIQRLRHDLVAWTLRRGAIDQLNDQMGLTTPVTDDADDGFGLIERSGKFGIKSVAPSAVEAQYVRIEWVNGNVGRVKIGDDGSIERSVVWGRDGRDRNVERLLVSDHPKIEDLASSLKRVHDTGL